ncbi:synaptic plasticity regulator PANTS [Eleutherodactylus coqui]|uniref:Synaptic plasticity regulator PANTS n=1 Tax=Eleutherodactylus coqui TaxID=57060 RepID=A0A8J6FGI4_ELECQ|nr:hypothetical protein GDO78_007388 [Eleutherodactylus coqui]
MDDTWRPPRDCNDYWDEWKHCGSFKNRVHYYYTHGGSPVCQQWKEDYTACKQWEKSKSEAAKQALIRSERVRESQRHNGRPVWTMRKQPPADWHRPLDR